MEKQIDSWTQLEVKVKKYTSSVGRHKGAGTSKDLIRNTKTVNRNGSQNDRLESIYYQILGKAMKNRIPMDNPRAIREIYNEIDNQLQG